jgi:hypothetical protein
MNKLLIGLLVVAVGAGAYFFLLKKEKPVADNEFKKEWIVGKWKMDALQPGKDSTTSFMVGIMALVDSNTMKYQYEFTREGTILHLLGDSVTKDTSHYVWNKEKQLVWKEDPSDSIGSVLQVLKLNKDSLQFQGTDSTVVLFSKLR